MALMTAFTHPQRDKFFRKMGLKWYNVAPIDEVTGLPIISKQQPYGMYHCQQINVSTLQEMKDASHAAGRVIKKTWEVVKSLDDETLLKLGFPSPSLKAIKADSVLPFTMRLDWCWNEALNQKKIIEINCQTPSFMFECLEGNQYASESFGMLNPNPEAHRTVRASLQYQLEKAAKLLGKKLSDCTVGFTALNNVEDLGTMHWLSKQTQTLGIKTLLFPLEFLGVIDSQGLYFIRNNTRIDILFMWYPLEWAIHDTDECGRRLWGSLSETIVDKQAVIVNFASGFVLQPKSIFSLINDLGADFFGLDASVVRDYFPNTSSMSKDIGTSYFAKPILGRQGEGGFAVYKGDMLVESSGNCEWYTNQQYVYQELLDLPTIRLEDREFTVLWGSWLFNVDDEFVSAGVGMRVSDGPITDDYSYWCPIGV